MDSCLEFAGNHVRLRDHAQNDFHKFVIYLGEISGAFVDVAKRWLTFAFSLRVSKVRFLLPKFAW